MALLVASSTFAQTKDYSNYNASYEIIGSDTAMIKVTVEGVAFNFLKVDGGDVNLGSFGRQHIDTFWIMETEMTCELFGQFYNSSNTSSKECVDYSQEVYSELYTPYGEMPILIYDDFTLDPFSNPGNYTTYTRSRNVVQSVVGILNNVFKQFTFSLPTAQQWLYAARGGSMSGDYSYSGSDNINEVAWYKGNSKVNTILGSGQLPHKVKQKNPNELGLYDMCGNAAELVDSKISGYMFVTKYEDEFNSYDTFSWRYYPVFCGGDALSDENESIPSLGEQKPNFMTFRLVLTPNKE